MTAPAFGQIHATDCVDGMARLPEACIDLAFADPPFNIGYKYDVYQDSLETDDYLRWSENWIRGIHRVLKDDGAFWLAIGDEYAAELKVLSQRVGFHCRSWVVWYYTFGVNCKFKFTRSHAHLFYFVKDEKHFKFNSDDPSVRVPSARQLVYNDRRANNKGRLPDDTWILRPQDLPSGFTADEDLWYFPRVAGTFKERAGFHGCQMPEQLLGRIIRSCSDPDDVVLDPFSGSATTVAVAKKLGRQFITFELSEEYVELGTKRLAGIHAGDGLVGAIDPLRSAPATGGKHKESEAERLTREAHEQRIATQDVGPQMRFQFDSLNPSTDDELIESFEQIHAGHSVDRVLLDPNLSEQFERACRRKSDATHATSWRRRLIDLRARGALTAKGVINTRPTVLDDATLQRFAYAAELAWGTLARRYPGFALDDFLIEPNMLADFDREAALHAADADTLTLRWCAVKLRGWAMNAREQVENFLATEEPAESMPFTDAKPWKPKRTRGAAQGGVYQIVATDDSVMFAGECADWNVRMADHFDDDRCARVWQTLAGGEPRVRTMAMPGSDGPTRRASLCFWLRQNAPTRCNLTSLWAGEVTAGEITVG